MLDETVNFLKNGHDKLSLHRREVYVSKWKLSKQN